MVQEFEGIQLCQSEDEIPFDKVQVLIQERIIQVNGHLFQYDCLKDKNLLVAKDCFLCIDRKVADKKHTYMFHVVDKQ